MSAYVIMKKEYIRYNEKLLFPNFFNELLPNDVTDNTFTNKNRFNFLCVLKNLVRKLIQKIN